MQKPNVISLDTAKRLKELGVKQECCYSYFHIPSKKVCARKTGRWYVRSEEYKLLPNIRRYVKGFPYGVYPAYLADEILDMLPDRIDIAGQYWGLTIDKELNKYDAGYDWMDSTLVCKSHESLAEAAGLLLCHLIENNIINTNKE